MNNILLDFENITIDNINKELFKIYNLNYHIKSYDDIKNIKDIHFKTHLIDIAEYVIINYIKELNQNQINQLVDILGFKDISNLIPITLYIRIALLRNIY